jgi:hypothetical protein
MRRVLVLCVSVLLLPLWSPSLFAQATGVIDGRVTDSGGATVPGATVEVTNEATNVSRTTTTNENGIYSFAALQPGTYSVRVELSGFASQVKNGLTLTALATVSTDFTIAVAGLTEEVNVVGTAVLVDTTQSVVAGSIATEEVENLPMLNRSIMGLVTLTPAARPAPILNSTKLTFGGGISVGGAAGRNVMMNVDGSENRDAIVGGPMMNFTLEGIQEFKLLAHGFSAQYGRSNNAVVEVVTKSGSSRWSGSGFAFGRNSALTAIEYFNKVGNLPESDYDREQVGGSIGGPLKSGKLFLFVASEGTNQTYTRVFPTAVYNEAVILAKALPNLLMVPSQFVPQPLHDFLLTARADYQINDRQSLFLRWGQQNQHAFDDQFVAVNSTNPPHPDTGPRTSFDENDSLLWTMVASHTWTIGNNSVNTLMVQRNDYNTKQLMPTDVPSREWPLQNLTFPSLEIGRTGPSTDQEFFQKWWQIKDDFARLVGNHSLKFGGDFNWFPEMGMGIILGDQMGRIRFFDNPSTIVNNTNGRYPRGFLTPGAVSSMGYGEGVFCGCTWQRGGPGDSRILGMKGVSGYFQDDWRVVPRITLNLGLRWDLDINHFGQKNAENNRAYQVLKAIGSEWGSHIPRIPYNNFSPRAGIAWDLTGDGKNIIRAGGGLYWDRYLMESGFRAYGISTPIIDIAVGLVNTGVGVGQLADYVYNVSPMPDSFNNFPAYPTELPFNASVTTTIMSPDVKNPYNIQAHGGYTRTFGSNLTAAVDYTHIEGRNEIRNRDLNPIEGAWDENNQDRHLPWGRRRFSTATERVFGQPNMLGAMNTYETTNKSQFDEVSTQVTYRRGSNISLQGSYTLLYARAYGGIISGALGGPQAPRSIDADEVWGPGEWGPSANDERHRVVLSGVFSLPAGIQVSPILQLASARPYTATQGQDLNADGLNNDLWIDPATGQSVSVNSLRGSNTYNLDTRVSKYFRWSNNKSLGLFAELYDITNRANFGNYYVGNARATNFRQPFSLQLGLPTSRQLQLGARFSF